MAKRKRTIPRILPGDKDWPRMRQLLERVRAMEPGTELTYRQIIEICGVDPNVHRKFIRKVSHLLFEETGNRMELKPRVGYVIDQQYDTKVSLAKHKAAKQKLAEELCERTADQWQEVKQILSESKDTSAELYPFTSKFAELVKRFHQECTSLLDILTSREPNGDK